MLLHNSILPESQYVKGLPMILPALAVVVVAVVVGISPPCDVEHESHVAFVRLQASLGASGNVGGQYLTSTEAPLIFNVRLSNVENHMHFEFKIYLRTIFLQSSRPLL